MSTIPTRSTTGCFVCKTKRKKCDETKPRCLRCQKSNIECPGYTYIEHSNKPTRKLRTLLAPRTLVRRSRTITRQRSPSINPEEIDLQPRRQSPTGYDPVTVEAPNGALGTSVVADTGTSSEAIDTSNPWMFLSSFSGSLHHPSTDFHTSPGFTLATTDLDLIVTPQTTNASTSMSSGQASLLEALFSLGQPPTQHAHPNTNLHPNPNKPAASNLTPRNTGMQDDVPTPDEEDLEGVVSAICRAPVLDKTAESNALPFLLQGYATWIRRMAFEPLKMAHIARDFVFRHFEDRNVSRWILTLLANIGSRIGSVEFAEGKNDPMLSALQSAVRQRLGTAKCNLDRTELVRALDSALETMVIHFFVSPFSDVMTLRQEAAPIFRQLCPGPPDATIDLSLLLRHPLVCLRQYAHVDILFSVVMDLPTLFRYDATNPGSLPSNPDRSMVEIQGSGCLQWLHGTPDQLTLLFTKMKSMRQSGLTPNTETVASIEHEIRELQPFSSSSSESFLVIVRFVVQECWRQVAFVYLFMAVCGDPSDTLRVKEAFKRFTKLLNGIKPGRLPDEFLGMNLLLIAPAAQRKRGREVVRQRILELHTRGRTFKANNNLLSVLEDYWARADAERRPITWSDVAASRKRVLHI